MGTFTGLYADANRLCFEGTAAEATDSSALFDWALFAASLVAVCFLCALTTAMWRRCKKEKEKEKEIELRVSAHRGHSNGGHPQNLLDGNEWTYYQSKRGLSPIGDWIDFVMSEDAVVIPSKIRIRNDN